MKVLWKWIYPPAPGGLCPPDLLLYVFWNPLINFLDPPLVHVRSLSRWSSRQVASPHPQSIMEGGIRAEFMLNKRTAHSASMVDLVVADWKSTAQGTCLYLQYDVGVMSVETSSESVDGCQQLTYLKVQSTIPWHLLSLFTLLDITCQGEACKGSQTKNISSIATVAIL